jgi:hypothetical protein
MAKFAKPLSDRFEFSERVDFFKSLAEEALVTRDIDLTSITQLKYDVTSIQMTGTYTFHLITYKDDTDAVYDHRFDVKYTYQVLNRINLSMTYTAKSRKIVGEYDGREQQYESETRWDHNLTAQVGYEIF